jgi:hypothetical protein
MTPSIVPSFIANAFQRKDDHGDQGTKPKSVNPLSYPKSTAPFSHELFKSPSSEYRGCPLWAWNTKLDKEQLLRQIDNFADMGMGGFHVCNAFRGGQCSEY